VVFGAVVVGVALGAVVVGVALGAVVVAVCLGAVVVAVCLGAVVVAVDFGLGAVVVVVGASGGEGSTTAGPVADATGAEPSVATARPRSSDAIPLTKTATKYFNIATK